MESEHETKTEQQATAKTTGARDERTFRNGVMTGVAAALVAFNVWLALGLADMSTTLQDFGTTVPVSMLTRVVISLPWLWGVPALGAALLALVIVKRPRTPGPYAIVMVALLWATAATWHYAQAPMNELANNISE
jgi:hypothetical protein